MSNEVMGIAPGTVLDHKDRNPLNNQKENLRLAGRFNQSNAIHPKMGRQTSGYIGVRKRRVSFCSEIKVNGKKKWLGSFKTELQAALAYDAAAITYKGEFAVLNFPQK